MGSRTGSKRTNAVNTHLSSHTDWRQSRWRAALWGSLALILVIPLIAMQFTTEVAWGSEDFLFAAILLGALGLAMEILFRLRLSPWVRAAGAALALFAFLLIWADAALGVF